MKLPQVIGKRVLILGLAREGTALTEFLARRGVEVTASDRKSAEELDAATSVLAGLPVRYALGGHPLQLLDDVDAVFVSPGVPLDIPLLQEARARGVPLSSETRLFAQSCPAPIVGITGSNGKTTTAALVSEMLRVTGWRTHLGGNIGEPLIGKLGSVRHDDRVVMELSSFQLELFGTEYGEPSGWSPPIASILNVTPNHLDRHGTMDAYCAAKRKILSSQRQKDSLLLCRDEPISWSMGTNAPADVLGFSLAHELKEGAVLCGHQLVLRLGEREHTICERGQLRLLGVHNVGNVLAASVLAGLAGGDVEAIRQVATEFTGVGHRLELIRERAGIRYYNDSIATTPERSIAAMRSFDVPLLLLAGGRDKHLPWGAWADLAASRVKDLLLFGEARFLIAQAVEKARARRELPSDGTPRLHIVDTMECALEETESLAQRGDVVLLSPGCTSFDKYGDFAERGDRFRDLVASLPRRR